MKKLLILYFIFSFTNTFIYSQCDEWIKTTKFTWQSYISIRNKDYDLAVDSFENIYAYGPFKNNIVFGQDTLLGDSTFLVKYSSDGNIEWSKVLGSCCSYRGITLDTENNIYASGGGYIYKYNPTGNLIWSAKGWGHMTFSDGYLYVAGLFESDTLILGNDTLFKVGADSWYDLFIAKYDTLGNILWATSNGQADYTYEINDIDVFEENIYITGSKGEVPEFGFVVPYFIIEKYDTSGNYNWQKRIFHISGMSRGLSLQVSDSIIYTLAYASSQIIIETNMLNLGSDFLIIKYNQNGILLGYSYFGSSTSTTWPYDMILSDSRNIYSVGAFPTTNSFDIAFAKANIVFSVVAFVKYSA